ncbi:MAG: PilT/PilU family type 4a pilus ATPase [Verrucomicrobiae bacterium]|nr:PilT/PilU family type 4a pilus ATPase [Verrucomicrobiae bacterium]
MNAFLIDTLAAQGWLDEEKMSALRQAVEADSGLSVVDFLRENGWLGEEHLAWLQSQAEPSAEQAGGNDESVIGVVQEGNDGADDARAKGLLPPEVEAGVVLGEDGALRGLNDYLKLGRFYGASDVHVGVYSPPVMRRFGTLVPMWPNAPMLTPAQTERLLLAILTENQKKQLKSRGDVDFCYFSSEQGRFRASVVTQRLGIDGVFRVIDSRVKTMEELGLPEHLKGLTQYNNGLVLITGPGGCGKSTTMAAFIEEVNSTRHDHIITIEDPIEFVFASKHCHITQREVHSHTESFSRALRAALREDPDIIMVGEMRDLETVSLAIRAAETGHLVFATLHTRNAARTLDRVLDVFPVEQQPQIRTMVAGSLRGVVSQQLIPRLDGRGQAMALEILINTRAVEPLIRDAKTFMLPGVMQTGKKVGCRVMDDSLLELVRKGIIAPKEAFERAENKVMFREFLQ